jgi:hypothetical protein
MRTGPARGLPGPILLPRRIPDTDSAQRGKSWISPKPLILFGAPEEIRTPDPQIRSLVLTACYAVLCPSFLFDM